MRALMMTNQHGGYMPRHSEIKGSENRILTIEFLNGLLDGGFTNIGVSDRSLSLSYRAQHLRGGKFRGVPVFAIGTDELGNHLVLTADRRVINID
jgi:hypothetical protein